MSTGLAEMLQLVSNGKRAGLYASHPVVEKRNTVRVKKSHDCHPKQ